MYFCCFSIRASYWPIHYLNVLRCEMKLIVKVKIPNFTCTGLMLNDLANPYADISCSMQTYHTYTSTCDMSAWSILCTCGMYIMWATLCQSILQCVQLLQLVWADQKRCLYLNLLYCTKHTLWLILNAQQHNYIILVLAHPVMEI